MKIKPEVIRFVIEPTGRFIVADPRIDHNDPDTTYYCVHNVTVAKNQGQYAVDSMLSRRADWPDPENHPIYIFEARNRTQVHEELRSWGYITDYQGYRKSNYMNAIDRRIRQAELAAERAQAEIDRLLRLPAEPVVEDDAPNVIFFQKRFSRGGRLYDYSAVKASDGLWYTTGPQSPKGYSWDRLVEWLYDGSDDTTVYVAKKFRPLS